MYQLYRLDTIVPHNKMKDTTSTMSRQHPAVILSSKEPTANVPIRQLMKPVKLTRKKSPSPVKHGITKNQASDTQEKEKKDIVERDGVVDQRKEDNAEKDTKLESQPVSSNNILLIQRNQTSFRTTGPNVEVMQTVTKPVILPIRPSFNCLIHFYKRRVPFGWCLVSLFQIKSGSFFHHKEFQLLFPEVRI